MSENDLSDSVNPNCTPLYTEYKLKYENTCMRCERKFTFKAYNFDDARFVRFCHPCKQRVRTGDYDFDFNETVGH